MKDGLNQSNESNQSNNSTAPLCFLFANKHGHGRLDAY